MNCASDSDKAERLFRSKESLIKKHFPQAGFRYVRKTDIIRDAVKEVMPGYQVIVACGGDGTVKETAHALIHSDKILGVIPIGSGNDFAKSIGLGSDFESGMEALIHQKITEIDVIQFNQDYFLNTLGMGVDGLTNQYAARLKSFFGKMRYFIGGLAALCMAGKFTFKLKRDGQLLEEGSSWMIVAANGAVEGGKYRISPDSDNRDGIFELVIVNPISRIRLLKEFLKLSFGFPFSRTVVHQIKGKSFQIEFERAPFAHADGEVLPRQQTYQYTLHTKALKVISAC